MKPSIDEIKIEIRAYLLEQFPEFTADDLNDSARLMTGGVLDSISTLQAVDFLEQRFNILFDAAEIDPDNLDTLPQIAEFVRNKIAD